MFIACPVDRFDLDGPASGASGPGGKTSGRLGGGGLTRKLGGRGSVGLFDDEGNDGGQACGMSRWKGFGQLGLNGSPLAPMCLSTSSQRKDFHSLLTSSPRSIRPSLLPNPSGCLVGPEDPLACFPLELGAVGVGKEGL